MQIETYNSAMSSKRKVIAIGTYCVANNLSIVDLHIIASNKIAWNLIGGSPLLSLITGEEK